MVTFNLQWLAYPLILYAIYCWSWAIIYGFEMFGDGPDIMPLLRYINFSKLFVRAIICSVVSWLIWRAFR